MITDLNKFRTKNQAPSLTCGELRCLECGCEWYEERKDRNIAEWLECPSCGLHKGRPKYVYEHPGAHWRCACGNELFSLTPDGAYCPHCGGWFTPESAISNVLDWTHKAVEALRNELGRPRSSEPETEI